MLDFPASRFFKGNRPVFLLRPIDLDHEPLRRPLRHLAMIVRMMPIGMAFLALASGATTAQTSSDPPVEETDEASIGDEFSIPVADDLAAEIQVFAADLGSPEYVKREDATRRLTEIGVATFATLRSLFRQTDELEVRLRIESIVKSAYLDHHIFDTNAFLGIAQASVPVMHGDDERIALGRVGIKVQRVIEGTAAERVKLQKGDVIIALDGETIKAGGARVIAEFGESIRVRGPGTLMAMTLLRGSEQLELEVILGRRPIEYYNRAQANVHLQLDRARQEFRVWWRTHFQSPTRGHSGNDRP